MGSDANHRGGSPRWIAQAVENSLRRLRTDHIDLYQMHRPDHATDIDETLSALLDLVRSGKVRAIGSSFFSPEADRRGTMDARASRAPLLPHGAAAVLDPDARH
jgi:aryl-alcohol dehydrogenase-like predicted oxidoreductase